jgi:hypothetical protein
MLWVFISDEHYYNPNSLSFYSKVFMPLLNVFFFFVRNNALWGCLDNLFTFLKLKPDSTATLGPQQRQQLIEILVVQYFCGIVMMPGANY